MDLKEIIDNYVDSLIMFEKAKKSDNTIEIEYLDNEKRRLHDLYIDKLYRASSDELKDLKEYLVNLINELHERIIEFEQKKNCIFNNVVKGNDMYIDELYKINKILDYLIAKKKRYENIVYGLKELIKTKIFLKKR